MPATRTVRAAGTDPAPRASPAGGASPSVSMGWAGSASMRTVSDRTPDRRRRSRSPSRRSSRPRHADRPRAGPRRRGRGGRAGRRSGRSARAGRSGPGRGRRRSRRARGSPRISIGPPSATIVEVAPSSSRVSSRIAAPTYAPNRIRRFHSCSAAAMIRASRPIPQATRKMRLAIGPALGPPSAPQRRLAEVDRPRLAVPDRLESRADAADAEGAREHVPGPRRDDREGDRATGHRRGGLADGSVAARPRRRGR